MRGLERKLFEEYKRVDGICRDLLSSPRGVSGYIEEMERAAARGRRWVPTWERDYRTLKRARWLRNKLAHELTGTDCAADDVRCLRDFRRRLLRRQDPLAALRRAERARRPAPSDRRRSFLWIALAVGALLLLALLLSRL